MNKKILIIIISVVLLVLISNTSAIDVKIDKYNDLRDNQTNRSGYNNQEEKISFIYGNYIGEEDFDFSGVFFNLELWAYFGTSIRIVSYTSILPFQKYIVGRAINVQAPIFIGFLKRSQPSGFGIIFGVAIGDIEWLEI
jgi:hypothetical protein